MEYRTVGRSGLRVSSICLGTAFRGAPDDSVCREVIHRALDAGINFIDTANEYQRGRSERIVGEALRGRRDEVVLTTKVHSPTGTGPNDRGLSRLHILREVENSLQRLQTDHVDVYFAHAVDADAPIDETLRAFDDLVRQGKVRYIGCSNFEAWRVCKGLWTSDQENLTSFSIVQDHYNLLDRRIERELVPLCRSEGVGMMTYSAQAVGLLTGRFRRGQPLPEGTLWAERPERFAQLMTKKADRVAETVVDIAKEHERTPVQVAVAWLLGRPGITAGMIGPDVPDHVDEALGALGWELGSAERERLEAVSNWAVEEGQII